MVEKIYEQLKTPKTLDEIHSRLNEIGINWNKAQVQLFLEMDINITNKNGLWEIAGVSTREIVLDVIDKAIGNRPIIPIKLIMQQTPKEIITSQEEILKFAIESGRFISPNGVTIKRKN